uniref:Uncharacterized protein n=1 Tax=Trichuris muris TaxID=70415 RepID=A0A5S6QAS7_TRIMR
MLGGRAVYLYNVTPRNGSTKLSAPANKIYKYDVRVRRKSVRRNMAHMQLATPCGRCVKTGLEVDGLPRHVRDLRRGNPPGSSAGRNEDGDDDVMEVNFPARSVPDEADRSRTAGMPEGG